jgi:hypothetical protein
VKVVVASVLVVIAVAAAGGARWLWQRLLELHGR